MNSVPIPRAPLHLLQVDEVSVEAFALTSMSPFRTPLRSVHTVTHPEHGHLGFLIEHAWIPESWDHEMIAPEFRRTDGKPLPHKFRWVRIDAHERMSLAFDKEQALVLLWGDFMQQQRRERRDAVINEIAHSPISESTERTENR